MTGRRRSAVRSTALLVTVIAAGLASRRYASVLPTPIQKRTGDALWAWAIFAALGWVRPRWTTCRVAAVTLVVAFADEFSQAYQAPWINHIRAYTVGHLILGSGFYWLDFLAYVVGVLAAILVDWGWVCRAAIGVRPKSLDSACVP